MARSGHIWRRAAKMLKMNLLRLILAISGARQPKCSNWASWGSFWPYLVPGSQNAQNEPPEAHSGQIWCQGYKYNGFCTFKSRAPWFSAYDAINTMGFVRLDWQLHGFRHMKL